MKVQPHKIDYILSAYRHGLIITIFFFSAGFAQFSHTFTYDGHVKSSSAWHIAVGPDGTVFMGNSFAGISAYTHTDTLFHNLRHVDLVGNEAGMVVRDDTVLFAASGHSVFALTYNDTTLLVADQISLGYAWPMDIAIGPDETVFVGSQSGGVSAFSYEDGAFTQIAQHLDPVTVDGIAVGPDGTVFLAARDDGFHAFAFEDSTFLPLDQIDVIQAYNVTVGPDNTVYMANGNVNGLMITSFHGTQFTILAQTGLSGSLDLDLGSEGTVFAANSIAGLRAYEFNGSEITSTAHINPGGTVYDVAVGPDGTIYAACDDAGWLAYRYETTTVIEDVVEISPHEFELHQNYPNPFNPTTTINYQLATAGTVSLVVYDILGNQVKQLAIGNRQSAGHHSVTWDGNNEAGEQAASGVYFYRLAFQSAFPNPQSAIVVARKMILMR